MWKPEGEAYKTLHFIKQKGKKNIKIDIVSTFSRNN